MNFTKSVLIAFHKIRNATDILNEKKRKIVKYNNIGTYTTNVTKGIYILNCFIT